MEGVLYKWTNYLSGWQPRWFLLCGGILSYYDSPEDAWKGCKGSIQMAVCEIQVHSADNTRMDLIIPGEQYFYLKARNVAERQRWLVALGSAKACLTDGRAQKEKEFTENTETLKTKMSELRLYCDLLVQQVNRTKEATAAGMGDTKEGIDVGTLLKSTCNTFLKTLEECMQIANAAFTSELLYRTPPGSPQLAVLKPAKTKLPIIPIHNTLERQIELNSCENGSLNTEINDSEEMLIKNESPLYMKPAEKESSLSTKENMEVQSDREDGERDTETPPGSDVEPPWEPPTGANPESEAPGAQLEEEEEEEEVQTFFSAMNTRCHPMPCTSGAQGLATSHRSNGLSPWILVHDHRRIWPVTINQTWILRMGTVDDLRKELRLLPGSLVTGKSFILSRGGTDRHQDCSIEQKKCDHDLPEKIVPTAGLDI